MSRSEVITSVWDELRVMEYRMEVSTQGKPKADALREIARLHKRLGRLYEQLADSEAEGAVLRADTATPEFAR